MNWLKRILILSSVWLLAVASLSNRVFAEHIIGGDIHWQCISSGPDAGKFVFYLALYRDCTVNTNVSSSGHYLEVQNNPAFTGHIPLNLVSQTDITQPGCGVSCAGANPGDVATEQFLFSSDPVAIPGTPPAQGFVITYHRCCRNSVDNLVSANEQEIYYAATMYPYNGQDVFPCYDSSPQFAETPTLLLCSGYELRYNSNATDADLDSLSYELVNALGNSGNPITYQPGYDGASPLPGPMLNPGYDQITLDPTTGQLEYDSPAGLQGRWTVVAAVYGWRCGQLISKVIREMSITIIACLEPNNPPAVSVPVWTLPPTASGYAVTVLAGDPVSFSLTGTDNDIVGGIPQNLEFTATGSQFGANFTDPNAGCTNTPCATLTNVSPPVTSNGSISTTFNWQTSCNHISVQDECANFSNSYNFLFKFKDDFCPARATNVVNVTVTVLAEPVVQSPVPHCASTAGNGDISLSWMPVTDNAVPPSFVEYAIFHSTSPGGPFQEIGAVPNINAGTYVHTGSNPVAAPNTTGPNYYKIRTRSGCNDAVLDAAVSTISSIYLTLNNTGTMAALTWTPVADPPFSSSTGIYEVWREYPAGTWTQIATTTDLFYNDPIIWCDEQVNYRIELPDDLPCVSVSNVTGDMLSNPAQPEPQFIDSVSVDPVTGLVTICWPPNPSPNVVAYNVYWNPDAFAWDLVATVNGYNNTCWTDSAADPNSGSLWYQVTATNNCGQEGIAAGSGADQTNRHQTIWLQDSVNGCVKEAYLYWTHYWYWPEGVREYEIYSSKDGGPFTKIAVVPDSTLAYIHQNLDEEATYCHFVRAVRNVSTRVTATSNKRCSYVYIPKRADYEYLYNSTVTPGNTGIQNYFFVDSTAGYLGFEIHRGKDPNSLGYIWFLSLDPTTRYYQYDDNMASPAFDSYYYTVIGIDSCELNADTLNRTRTIFLEANANPDRTNTIQWNGFEGWRGGVSGYRIFRSVDGAFSFLRNVAADQRTYTDSIQEIIIGEGNFCYYVEAVEGVGPPVGPDAVQFQETSRSNEACAFQPPNVFVPNAFAPEGVNNILKPITVYVAVSDYLFQVYDRWGNRVFESIDPAIGWNGTYKGNKSPLGVYAFFIRFVSSKGDTYTKTGSVTLIR